MSDLLYVSRSLLVKEPFGVVNLFDQHVYCFFEGHLLEQQFLIEFLRQIQQAGGAADQRLDEILLVCAQVKLLHLELRLDLVGAAGDAVGGRLQAIGQRVQIVVRDVLGQIVDVLVRFKVVQLRPGKLLDLLASVVVQDSYLRRDLNVVGQLLQLLNDAELLGELLDLIDVQQVLQSQHLEHGLVAMAGSDDLRHPQRLQLLVLLTQRDTLVLREDEFVEIDVLVEVREDLVVLWVPQRVTAAATQDETSEEKHQADDKQR